MNKKRRLTLAKLFEKPERSDITWADIEGLFKALRAELSEGRDSRIRVANKGFKAVFHRSHPGPDAQQ